MGWIWIEERAGHDWKCGHEGGKEVTSCITARERPDNGAYDGSSMLATSKSQRDTTDTSFLESFFFYTESCLGFLDGLRFARFAFYSGFLH